MGASRKTGSRQIRRGCSSVAGFGVAVAVDVLQSSTASASSRVAIITATTSPGSGGVLLVLVGAVLVLGGIGFVVFTWTRRKRRPSQCAEQRAALELAEQAVRFWEAARAHLEAVEKQRTLVDDAAREEEAHASLMAKAVEGMNTAMKQRDQCQMDLIRCMASGVPAVPVIPQAPTVPQPFFTPGTDGTTTSNSPDPA